MSAIDWTRRFHEQNEMDCPAALTGTAADLTEPKLAEIIGKKVRLRGKLRIEQVADFARSVIWIESRSAIQVLE